MASMASWPLALVPTDEVWLGVAVLLTDIQREVSCLAYLPLMVNVGYAPLMTDEWCWAAPLWDNPYLLSPVAAV